MCADGRGSDTSRRAERSTAHARLACSAREAPICGRTYLFTAPLQLKPFFHAVPYLYWYRGCGTRVAADRGRATARRLKSFFYCVAFREAHSTCKMCRRNEILDSKKILFAVLNRCEICLDRTNQEQAIIKRKD